MLMHEALEALEDGQCDAIVFQDQTANTFHPSASVIIRRLKTPDGGQYTRHELDFMGRTGSGFYAQTIDEILSHHYKIEAGRNSKLSRFAMMRQQEAATKHWALVNDDELPDNLVVRGPRTLTIDTNVEAYLGV